jgi:hypothetical protein
MCIYICRDEAVFLVIHMIYMLLIEVNSLLVVTE